MRRHANVSGLPLAAAIAALALAEPPCTSCGQLTLAGRLDGSRICDECRRRHNQPDTGEQQALFTAAPAPLAGQLDIPGG